MNVRRIARVVYILAFVGVVYGTDLLPRSSPLFWLAIAGLVVVFFDAVICARRRFRVLSAEREGDDSETDPSC